MKKKDRQQGYLVNVVATIFYNQKMSIVRNKINKEGYLVNLVATLCYYQNMIDCEKHRQHLDYLVKVVATKCYVTTKQDNVKNKDITNGATHCQRCVTTMQNKINIVVVNFVATMLQPEQCYEKNKTGLPCLCVFVNLVLVVAW